MDIVVLAGGLSPERDVSLSSGAKIANALIKKGHRVLLADVFTGVDEVSTFDEAFYKYHKDEYSYTVPSEEPDLEALKGDRHDLIGENILSICESADVSFLGLHGAIGENGQLQAVLDTHGIRYTGSGYAGSCIAMDKAVSKELMSFHNVLTPKWEVFSAKNISSADIHIKVPCVIKPLGCGSSVGVSIVNEESQLDKAIEYVKKYEDKLMVEEKILGREFSVGVLDGEALPVIEIIPKAGFYDYKNKYQAGLTEEICPAALTDEQRDKMQNAAIKVHEILRLGSYSRVDFILDDKGDAYCLEANTLPGMTPTSLLPQEAKACGISYEDLCEKIVQLAL